MRGGRSVGRALALAGAIPLVVGLAGIARGALEPAGAGALAVDALSAAAAMGLLALAGASLASEGPAARLGLGRGCVRGGSALLAVVGLVGLSHAAEGVLGLAGLDASPALARFERALGGLGPGALGPPLAAIALGSSLGEELLFRGFVQRGLDRTAGSAAAIGLSAAAFGAVHGDWAHGGAAFVLGLYLGGIAHAAGSIRPAIAAHAANNAVAVLEAASGFRLPGATEAAWAWIALGLGLGALGVRSAWIARRRASVLGGFGRP